MTATTEAWALVTKMIDDMAAMVAAESETELEHREGLRVLGRVLALCSELSLDTDVASPWFFDMNTPARYVGGPNPDGRYALAMIDGSRRYRIDGKRGTTAYLGFQVLAGVGLTPRRMAAYVSDGQLQLAPSGEFSLVLSSEKPSAPELDAATWVEIPEDASAIVVREYVADPTSEAGATLDIRPLDEVGAPQPPDDDTLALQLTSMAFTIAKLMTLHRTIRPDLLETPNILVTAEAAELGSAETTPDNLYMIGTFRLDGDEALEVTFTPPPTRYWNVTLENIWHECIDPRRRRSHLTSADAVTEADGSVRLVISRRDPGGGNWLDTGGRHRGFVLLRWIDNPEAPEVTTRVIR